ncbi:MAG TPA: AAA family ATPase, partial [Kofleriaceae bacterium]|nr:AAA family ATPase [Kofleriaceae bacterium]
MIRAVQIARFRGIRDCVAEGLGRVNLIIGRNDCGKTAFLEALRIADDGENAARCSFEAQRARMGGTAKVLDFERYWRPIFFDLDAGHGFSISILRRGEGEWRTLKVQRDSGPQQLVLERVEGPGTRARDEGVVEGEETINATTWALSFQLTMPGREPVEERVAATSSHVKIPARIYSHGGVWIGSGAGIGENEIRFVSTIRQRGEDAALVEVLSQLDERLTSIELLAPSGDVAELFVRLDNGTPMLPVRLMGEGFQRCLEIAAAAAAHDWPTLFIDEIENGMHHLVLEPLWRWLAMMSRRRDLQVFATTHSEECIHAACRAFQSLDDDGLRVIRLDRLESGTRATSY